MWEAVRDAVRAVREKQATLREMLARFRAWAMQEATRAALLAACRELLYLLRHFSPREAAGEIAFSLGDPSQTGLACGAAGMLFPFWERYQIQVEPDFQADSIYAKGEVSLTGHIRIVHFLVSLVRLICNRDVRKMIAAF